MKNISQRRMYSFVCATLIVMYVIAGLGLGVTTDAASFTPPTETVSEPPEEPSIVPQIDISKPKKEFGGGPKFEIRAEIKTDDEIEVESGIASEESKPVVSAKWYYNVPLSRDLQDHIFELCKNYNVDPTLVISMIFRESAFIEGAIGDNGDSFGLMQIQPKWFRERMAELGLTNLLDPYQNVILGIDYVAELMSRGNSIDWVLMAYNGGEVYANRMAAKGIVSEYASTIINYQNELQGAYRYDV